MKETVFYKPRRAKWTSQEEDFMAANNFYFTVFHPLMTRRVADLPHEDFNNKRFTLGPVQITYNFPSTIRNNIFPINPTPSFKNFRGTYGASGWSYRLLYEFLCEAYNWGMPFIDTYFKRFKLRPVYWDFVDLWDDIQDDINNELYKMPQRDEKGRFIKLFDSFAVFRDPIVKNRCKILACSIQDDIVNCLKTGQIPLRGKEGMRVSPTTAKIRKRFPTLHANQLFYASGRLIKHLNIYVEVGDKEALAA